MDLHVTLIGAPPHAFPAQEIVVDTARLPTGAALCEQLLHAGLAGPFSVDGASLEPLHLEPLHLGTTAVPPGSVIVSGRRPPVPGGPLPHLVFVVHSGPDAGQVVPLVRAGYTIGRAACDITVADPGLSRAHALLTVGEDSIVVEDLRSANGTFVDGLEVESAAISVSSELRFGSSRCSIELADERGWTPGTASDILDPVPIGHELPKRPSRILVLTALLPLLLGTVLALTTGMWFFLAFSGLSAVTGLVPLLTHRRNSILFAAALEDAGQRDRRRRAAAVPDPGQSAVDALRLAHRPGADPPTGATPPAVVLLRLGTADQPARVCADRVDASFTVPTLRDLPFHLPCRPGGDGPVPFTVLGDPDAVRALQRALLLQTAHARGAGPLVVLWAATEELAQHARFLPNVRLTRDPAVLAGLAQDPGVVLVLHAVEDVPGVPGAATVLPIRFLPGPPSTSPGHGNTGDRCVITSADAAHVHLDGEEYDLVPDGVSAQSFERAVRASARSASPAPARRGRAHGAAPGGPPRSASLWSDVLRPDTVAGLVSRQWITADPSRPTVHLGSSSSGSLSVDLVRDGPHFLVAGTTGSGKSEFLRTLVLGLSLNQPPEHLSLLLIDYKGGSGLGALAALPHCVGSLTDLSSESTARALTSLRAELRERETRCADHGVHDLDTLRRVAPATCPPRLVVVVDEFRMLSDEVPTAVPDLMKIAALGRSLGVHLVLATQRAQGAVTPDLRANITSSILLRVQTAMESQDLLGSGAAAEIPVDLPGRAFFRRGAETPVSFQVATSSTLPPSAAAPGWQHLTEYLGERQAATAPARAASVAPPASASPGSVRPGSVAEESASPGSAGFVPEESGTVMAQAVTAVVGAAGGPGRRRPRGPVLPPLPAVVTPDFCRRQVPADGRHDGSPGHRGRAVALGVIDLPERQDQRALLWCPEEHSHLALVGLPASGIEDALSAVVAGLPPADPDIHLYLLDGDGTLAGHAQDDHTGAYVGPAEPDRAARVLERLTALPGDHRRPASRTVLAVTGWGRWSNQFRQGRPAGAEEDLHALVRDGAGCGVTVLIAGDRELTASRFFALVPNRIYLPLGAHQETTMTWPRLPAIDAVRGRGLVQGRITGGAGDAVGQLVLEVGGSGVRTPAPTVAPFPVHPLPRAVTLEDLEDAEPDTGAADPNALALALGLHGDDLRPYRVQLRSGEVFLVLGHASSGRSNTLRVLEASASLLLPRSGVLAPRSGATVKDAIAYWRAVLAEPAGQGSLLLVDDADQLPADVQQGLSSLVARGAAAVLAAAPSPSLMARVPLSLQARGTGTGLVLSPRSSSDGDFLGVRLDVRGAAVRGRGFACGPFGVQEVQVACAPRSHSSVPAADSVPAAHPVPTTFARGTSSGP